MNTITKEYIIQCLSNNLFPKDLYYEYFKDNRKEGISLFLDLIKLRDDWKINAQNKIIEFYKHKFNIITVYNKQGAVIKYI